MLLVVSTVVAVGLGPVTIPPGTVVKIFTHHLFGWSTTVDWTRAQVLIVEQVRLPRILLGVAVGGSDLTGSAFLGGLGSMVLVFLLGRIGGKVSSIRLLLAGVAVGYVMSAITSFMIFASDSEQGAQDVLFWLLGSLSLAVFAGFFSGQLDGSASLADTELHTLGMTNTFGDFHQRTAIVSVEELINRNPGIIGRAIPPRYNSKGAAQALSAFLALPGIAKLPAVAQHRIIVVDDTYLLSRPAGGVQLLYNKISALR